MTQAGPKTVQAMEQPTPLYRRGSRAIYWLGLAQESAFRCNAYLLCDGEEGLLVDPGGRAFFPQIRQRVAQIMPTKRVTGMILSHQDPDVASSMADWLELNPDLIVFANPRTQVLLPFYGKSAYRYHDVEAEPEFYFTSGAALRFIPAPFLHFAGAMVSYDLESQFLFSGDIWAALDLDWQLYVEDFAAHIAKMDLFHTEYMASNLACRGFLAKIAGLPLAAILPQHGSIIDADSVAPALAYLRDLQCGTDIIYAALD